MLAKAIAKESGAVFINVRVPNLMSKWFGDAQKLGYGMMGGGGIESFRFSSSSANGEGQLNTHLSRLKAQVDLGPGRSNSIGHLPRIPEIGAEATNDSGSDDDDARFHSHGFSFTSWNDNSCGMRKHQQDNRILYSGLGTSAAPQNPRPLSQQDLENVLGTSKLTRTTAHDYSRMSASEASWLRQEFGDDRQES